jgi:peptidoglycan hydrolase-like protein with peptidoglycan-binding domain
MNRNIARATSTSSRPRASLHRCVLGAALAAAAAASCGPVPETDPAARGSAGHDDLARAEADLAPGARGQQVQALQDYLAKRGYLPNAELARTYPSWRPVVPSAPTPGVYDATTESAVRAFQRARQLPETGVVNAATRAFFGGSHCGVPDGISATDHRDKFVIDNWAYSQTNITWRLVNNAGDDGITGPQARTQIALAFQTWSNATNLTFTDLTDTPTPANIQIVFSSGIVPENAGQYSGGVIGFNTLVNWSIAATTPVGSMDLQSVALHEVGHALGLLHSTVGTQQSVVMNIEFVGTNSQNRSLSTDDKLAISILYSPWQNVPGCATDIGVSGTGSTDIVWIAGCNGGVFKYAGGVTWNQDLGAPTNPMAIAVQANGRPWLVRTNGEIYRKNSSSATSGTWTQITGCAQDIGIGTNGNATGGNGDGTVWVVGCSSPGTNGALYRFNGTFFDLDAPAGGAPPGVGTRVAVDSGGQPWLAQTTGYFYRKTSGFAAGGTWQVLDPSFVATGGDIGVFRGGSFVWSWITTQSPAAIWIWNEQPQGLNQNGTNDIYGPMKKNWQWEDGYATRISVGPCGPWVVQAPGNIYRKLRCQAP